MARGIVAYPGRMRPEPQPKIRLLSRRRDRWIALATLFAAGLLAVAISLFLRLTQPQAVQIQGDRQVSHYQLHAQDPFNQPQYYPLGKTVASAPYLPVNPWVGRLILPSRDQAKSAPSDWVWLEVQQAPPPDKALVGKTVRLEWSQNPAVQVYVQAVTQDVQFTDETRANAHKGNVHPDRLDGRRKVGPLQSLAGARPQDDVIVALANPVVRDRNGSPVLQVDREPVLSTGQVVGLVKILAVEPVSDRRPASPACPGGSPCGSEYFRVQHYTPQAGKFDGAIETIRIPQVRVDRDGQFQSTPRQLEQSPAGKDGWYVYGARDRSGLFTVQALEPRSLLRLATAGPAITGLEAGLTYIKEQNWLIKDPDKGTVRSTPVSPTEPQTWSEGDRAIVVHNFGGIGGRKAEPLGVPNTITGHFAYGVAQVVRDRITNEPRFDLHYQQVYTHNPNGIIAGSHTWANYMGNLRWGWLGTRPVSDLLIKFPPVTQDYDFGGIPLSPLQEFLDQLQGMMARYRVGDGTGFATVTPATSCIQDSSQALYLTIKRVRQQVQQQPAIAAWMQSHPTDPQTLRFQQLADLGTALEKHLTPLGIVRADWDSPTANPFRDPSIWAGLTSWRTMMPRQAHDELAAAFLKLGANLWFLRTNQVGGVDPDIVPLAPTELLGEITVPATKVSLATILFNRALGSLALPNRQDWLITLLGLGIYSAIALPIGFSTKFLRRTAWNAPGWRKLLLGLRLFLMPALGEELVFRVLWLPHPAQVISWGNWSLWATIGLLLFVLYHPLNAKIAYKAGDPTFFKPAFLLLSGLLGLTCTIVYALTGALLPIVLIHWLVVVVWLLALGGVQKLSAAAPEP
jgi:predicted Abi (CAAX) family protease